MIIKMEGYAHSSQKRGFSTVGKGFTLKLGSALQTILSFLAKMTGYINQLQWPLA